MPRPYQFAQMTTSEPVYFSDTVIETPSDTDYLIRESQKSALVLSKEYTGVSMDMIFNNAEYAGEGFMKVNCIFSRENWEENFGKSFLIPYDRLTSYTRAIDLEKRDFIEEGDLIVGLPSSSTYSITSCNALFIGKAKTFIEYGWNGEVDTGKVHRRNYGDTYFNVETIFSLEGRSRETHEVNATHFIPTKNPSRHFEKEGASAITHVAIFEDTKDLKGGVIYPIDKIVFKDNSVDFKATGSNEFISYGDKNIKLIGKGEL